VVAVMRPVVVVPVICARRMVGGSRVRTPRQRMKRGA